MSRYCEICDAVAPMHTMTCPNHIRTSDNKRIKELEAELSQCLDCCKRVGELEVELADKDKCMDIVTKEGGKYIKELEAERYAAADKLYGIGASFEVSTRAGIEIQAIAAELRESRKQK